MDSDPQATSLRTDELDRAGQLIVFATRHWVFALSEGRRLPCCVPSAFIKSGVADVFEPWQELLHFLQRHSLRRLTFGPLCNHELTPAEGMLVDALHDLRVGLLGRCINRLRGLVDDRHMVELMELLESIAQRIRMAGHEIRSARNAVHPSLPDVSGRSADVTLH